MDGSNNPSTPSTSAPDETRTHDPSPSLPCSSLARPPQNTEDLVDSHSDATACHACTLPLAYACSDTQASSSCSSTSIFDDEFNDSLAESFTASSHQESDRIAAEDGHCSSILLPWSPTASVIGSLSSTTSRTLVEDSTRDDGSISQYPFRNERHAASPINGQYDPNAWSDDDTVTITQTDHSELEFVDTSADTTVEPLANSLPVRRRQLTDEVKRSHLQKKSEALFGVSKPEGQDDMSLEPHLKLVGRQGFRQRYLAEDSSEAPWTMFHLRSMGSICAFCGSTFTGHDHKQKVINHTRDIHLATTSSLSLTSGKSRPLYPRSRLPKASDMATKRSSHNRSTWSRLFERKLLWPELHPLQHPIDFKGFGSRWTDELRLKQEASRPRPLIANTTHTAHHSDLVDHPGSKALLDRVVSRINSVGGRCNAEKLNDFLNGFDLIAEDLSYRYPRNGTVVGIQNALASLDQASSSCSRWTTSATCSTDYGSAPQDNDSLPSSSATPASNASRGPSGGRKAGDGRKCSQLRDRKNSSAPGTATATKHKKQKLRNRYLACPFQKEEIMNNRHVTCRYGGAESMSTLRTHLAGQQHRSALPFIELCSSCKEYVINVADWNNAHIRAKCIPLDENPRVQIRNSPSNDSRVGAQWLRLFVNIFSDTQWLPSPYVHDSSWIPRIEFRSIEHTEYIARTEFPLFNLNEFPSLTAQHGDVAIATHETTTSPMPTLTRVDSAETSDATVREPTPAGPQFQSLVFSSQDVSNGLAFLDDLARAVHYDPRQTSDGQSQSPNLAGNDGDERPVLEDNGEEFGSYFNFGETTNGLSFVNQELTTPVLEDQSQHATYVQSQHDDDESAQRATLLFLLQQIEHLIGPYNPAGEHTDTLAQRMARVLAMSPEEVRAFADTLLASIEQLRTTAPARNVTMPLRIATSSRNVVPTVSPDSQAMAHHSFESHVASQGHDTLPYEQAFPNPFEPIEWEDTESLNGNSSPDPTIRTFFPEDLLISS